MVDERIIVESSLLAHKQIIKENPKALTNGFEKAMNVLQSSIYGRETVLLDSDRVRTFVVSFNCT